MKKKKCQITGEELTEISIDEALEIIDALAKAIKTQAFVMAEINKHFQDHHSLSFVQFEQIKKLIEG